MPKKESNRNLFFKKIYNSLIEEVINYKMKEITLKITDETIIKELETKIESVEELKELLKEYIASKLKKNKPSLNNRINVNSYAIVKEDKGILITKIENCIKITLLLSKEELKTLESLGIIKDNELNYI